MLLLLVHSRENSSRGYISSAVIQQNRTFVNVMRGGYVSKYDKTPS